MIDGGRIIIVMVTITLRCRGGGRWLRQKKIYTDADGPYDHDQQLDGDGDGRVRGDVRERVVRPAAGLPLRRPLSSAVVVGGGPAGPAGPRASRARRTRPRLRRSGDDDVRQCDDEPRGRRRRRRRRRCWCVGGGCDGPGRRFHGGAW